ncbi:Hydroxyacylglutathione hydrolase [Legionella massiliensis]|uniref:Hydroxyacylglutathione hydrolase n=1 Tax=Legionella massiliensis TaxID=1034943 RepID=A0A078KZ34_9GAMM|nr:hydroxyacylglutathione hydrolase [Legionella massiliensis]CDZ78201.1 Hydroxyacylglutathione hydrolase [Legionella massiliensis]CEE13939.1 Hydroxyacylglutathione hydrolase [Legionella massiliensis]
MHVQPIRAFYDNYIWLIINEKTQQALCVDPGDAQPVLSFLDNEKLSLNAILLTHHHNDHVGGTVDLLQNNPTIPVYGPQDSRIPQVTHILRDGDVLTIETCEFKILSTPGHTSTHISYYEPHHHWLFCGDTLFSAGCGRVFDGTLEELHQSLQKLKNLPEETQVFCAHEYTSRNLQFATRVEPENLDIRRYAHRLLTREHQCSLPSSIAVEKKINPFLRTESSEAQTYAKQRGCKSLDSLSVFEQIRADKDQF